jgi:formylglycine-generating enzyme required for sulfatase activity
MRKVVVFALAVVLFAACDPVDGNLVGVKGRTNWYPDVLGPGKVPYGMVYIPSGAFQAGQNDKDIMGLYTTRNRTVSIQAFYMDASEISNNEYRQFVYWVRDSIAREKLYRRQSGEDAEQWVNVPEDFFRDPYRTIMDMGSDLLGGNNAFDVLNSTGESEELDKAYLAILGYQGNSSNPSNSFKVGNTTIPTAKFKRSKAAKTPGDIDVTLNSDEVSDILSAYGGKNAKADDKNNKSQTIKATLSENGGRAENRKYFQLNWETPVEYSDPELQLLLSDMYVSKAERFFENKQIDTRLLFYDYYWVDYKEAAKRGKIEINANGYKEGLDTMFLASNRRNPLSQKYKSAHHRVTIDPNSTDQVMYDGTIYPLERDKDGLIVNSQNLNLPKDSKGNPDVNEYVLKNPGQDLDLGYTNSKGQHNAIRGHTDRSRYIIKERIHVYPDTLCWVRDFTYSYHDPMAENYFWHTAYDNYPVVGVTWCQAKAFSVWRTQLYHSWLLAGGDLYVNDFRLPSEMEWERAARGDLELSQYPWGGPYIRNANGCFLANFKPMRGRYFEDGGFHTVKVYSYNPNAYGLYCMAGNVAEWCNSAFDESAYEFTHDLNTEYVYDAKDDDHPVKKRKVIRGGSWKDVGYYLQNGTRTFEYQDTAKCYIGFRNVMTHLGRGGKDLDAENGEEIQMDIQLK